MKPPKLAMLLELFHPAKSGYADEVIMVPVAKILTSRSGSG
jgi:hypothetical protein